MGPPPLPSGGTVKPALGLLGWCLLMALHPSRHWKELMEKTGVFFEMTETFTLENMFAMELHSHTEVLNEIVTAAVK